MAGIRLRFLEAVFGGVVCSGRGWQAVPDQGAVRLRRYAERRPEDQPGGAGPAHKGSGRERPDAERPGDPGRGGPGYLQREPGREHCPDAGKAPVLPGMAPGGPHPPCRKDADALPAGL